MFSSIDSTNWLVAATCKDQTEYFKIMKEQQNFNRGYQKFMSVLMRIIFISVEIFILLQSFQLILVELIPQTYNTIPDMVSLTPEATIVELKNFFWTSFFILLYMGLIRSFFLAASSKNTIQNSLQTEQELSSLRLDFQVTTDSPSFDKTGARVKEKDLQETQSQEDYGINRRICQYCKTYKEHNVHHCKICQQCIIGLDHHCYMLGNCVGESNYKYFISFTFYVLVLSIMDLWFSHNEMQKIVTFQWTQVKVNPIRLVTLYFCGVFLIIMDSVLLITHLYVLINNTSQLELKYPKGQKTFPISKIFKAVLKIFQWDFVEINLILFQLGKNWRNRCQNGIWGLIFP